jgi:hypothetical protein
MSTQANKPKIPVIEIQLTGFDRYEGVVHVHTLTNFGQRLLCGAYTGVWKRQVWRAYFETVALARYGSPLRGYHWQENSNTFCILPEAWHEYIPE